MIAKTYTCSLLGIDAILVEVEVDLASGLPGFSTVGLPDNIAAASCWSAFRAPRSPSPRDAPIGQLV